MEPAADHDEPRVYENLQHGEQREILHVPYFMSQS